MTLDSKVRVSPRAASADVQDEVVVLGLATSKYYGIDHVGARIWKLLVEGRTLREIHGAIQTEFRVDAATSERDLIEFVESLAREQLVTVEG